MVENRFNKQAEVKKKESVNTINTPSLLLYFSCWIGSKIDEKTVKTSAENESEFKCGFEVRSFMCIMPGTQGLGP